MPLPDLRRLQAFERRAQAEVVEEADIEMRLAAHRDWVAAGPARRGLAWTGDSRAARGAVRIDSRSGEARMVSHGAGICAPLDGRPGRDAGSVPRSPGWPKILPVEGFHAGEYCLLRVGSYQVVYMVEGYLITVSRVDAYLHDRSMFSPMRRKLKLLAVLG